MSDTGAHDAVPNPHGAVAVMDEPHHHLVLQTPICRVYWVEIAPGESTLLHRHNFDYATVVIGEAKIGDRRFGKDEQIKFVADLYTFYSRAAFEHSVRNVGNEPFLNFTITLLRNGAGPENSLFEDLDRRVPCGRIFDERSARAAEVKLAPGQSLELHGDNIIVAPRTCDIRVEGSGIQRIERAATLFCCTGRTPLSAANECDIIVVGIR